MEKRFDTHMPRDGKGKAKFSARFIRLPSIAETKMGTGYNAPVRLDPRVLDHMQQTIKTLSIEYGHKLTNQIHELLHMVEDACSETSELRSKFYDMIHDIRGLAGTFGHPSVGQFANSLCRYMEESHPLNPTILRFHVEAMNDALEDKMPDRRLVEETLRGLEKLIVNARREGVAI